MCLSYQIAEGIILFYFHDGNCWEFILFVLVLLLNPAYLYVDVNSDTDGDIAMLGFELNVKG